MKVDKRLAFLSFIPCHRLPSRSIYLNGKPFPLCARCMAILLGYVFLPVLFLLPLPFYVGFLLQLPMLMDGLSQYGKWRESTNQIRIITGLLSGGGQGVLIVSAVNFLVESLM
ncbi:DUF2085 domain-containing protein [uncultured Brevibacillus sp.]|uniref:DUF2085 domain-containing protein n=1 Tax=uncultured Brevibacillus sp. TaxID=169970 RepID=UPI0025971EB2|nr:DUF2085 domain-containing protein [uncultured Brevibacillus sp.]